MKNGWKLTLESFLEHLKSQRFVLVPFEAVGNVYKVVVDLNLGLINAPAAAEPV